MEIEIAENIRKELRPIATFVTTEITENIELQMAQLNAIVKLLICRNLNFVSAITNDSNDEHSDTIARIAPLF
jgi:hypothetical protein